MKTQREFARNGIFVRSAVLLVATFFSASALAETDNAVFTMTVYKDNSAGTKIIKGEYGEAIERITERTKIRDRFSDQTSLCVAYTKKGDLGNARPACEAALTEVRNKKPSKHRNAWSKESATRRYEERLALALSNQGVLLAVTGDTKLARAHFEEAMNLDSALQRKITTNLARLNEMEVPST